MQIAGFGLLAQFLGYLAILGGGAYAAIWIAMNGLGRHGLSGAEGAVTGGYLAAVGIGLLGLGLLFCLATPNDAGRMILIGGLGCFTGTGVLARMSVDAEQPLIFSLFAVIALWAGIGCLLAFYGKMAAYIGDRTLQEKAESFLKLFSIALLLTLCGLIPVIGPLLAGIATIIELVLLVRVVVINGQLASRILRPGRIVAMR